MLPFFPALFPDEHPKPIPLLKKKIGKSVFVSNTDEVKLTCSQSMSAKSWCPSHTWKITYNFFSTSQSWIYWCIAAMQIIMSVTHNINFQGWVYASVSGVTPMLCCWEVNKHLRCFSHRQQGDFPGPVLFCSFCTSVSESHPFILTPCASLVLMRI